MDTPPSLALACALPLALAVAPFGCKDSSPPKLTGGPTPSAIASASVIRDEPSAPPDLSDRFPLSDDELAKIVNPSGASEYTGPTGTIEGVVRVTGDPPRIQKFKGLPPECGAATTIVHGPTYRAGPKGALADALVAVIGYSVYVRPSREDKVITIHDCAIDPPVVDLALGQRLRIANRDEMPWAPMVQTNAIVTRLTLKGQAPPPLMITQPGAHALTWIAGLEPGVETPMATVFVLPNALHAVSGRDGKFRITGVPVGKVRVTGSHLFMPEAAKEVEVEAGRIHTVELSMTYREPKPVPAASVRKPLFHNE